MIDEKEQWREPYTGSETADITSSHLQFGRAIHATKPGASGPEKQILLGEGHWMKK